MRKIVFINPWLLFIFFWVVSIFCGSILVVTENHITSLSGLVAGYFASLVLIWFQLFWPHATYKHLAGRTENLQLWNSRIFDWPKVLLVTLLPTTMVMSAYIDSAEVSKPIYSLLETVASIIFLVFFIMLFAMLWGIARMLKGGIGWCVALFYWPLLAVFAQNKIRELYPETETN
ncbi:MAG: hypothetical protein ABJN69_11170 [Hellea sp.]